MSELTKYTELLLDEAAKGESSRNEVCADYVQETKVVYENTDFSMATTSESTVFGLRSIVGDKLGFVTTNSLNEKDLRAKAREAQQIARLSQSSPFHDIAAKQESSGVFEIYDEKLANVQPKLILEWADLLVKEARKDKRVALDRAEISLTTSTRVIHNSNGVFQTAKQSIASWYVMGMAKDGDEVTSFDYDGDSASHIEDVKEKISKTADEFRTSVIGSLGARTAKSYRGAVLFHPAAVANLLGGVISFNVNARAQQDGMSPWKESFNKEVAHKSFSLTENPLDVSRPGGWTPFDREGVLTQNRAIVENGVLKFTAHNAFTAKRGKTKTTGNASGGSRSIPGIGLHNLSVLPGTASEKELLSALGTGLVLKRFSGNEDPISGEFSGVAKNSWWVENGKRTHALKEVMVAGNMFDLLKQIKLIGSEIIRLGGSFDSPYILIDGVSVTSS